MNTITHEKKRLSYILKIIVIVSAFVGTSISAYGDGSLPKVTTTRTFS